MDEGLYPLRSVQIGQTDHGLDSVGPNPALWYVAQDVHVVVHVQPMKYVLDLAECAAPAQQHELDHMQISNICPQRSTS